MLCFTLVFFLWHGVWFYKKDLRRETKICSRKRTWLCWEPIALWKAPLKFYQKIHFESVNLAKALAKAKLLNYIFLE